jgi:YVTN family beta-propeller protein
VSDETGGAVVVIDPDAGTVIRRIPVGKRPRGIRASHDGRSLFVALSGSPIAGPGVDESTLPPADRAADGIGVVDVTSHRLVRTLPSGRDPEAFDLSADGKRLYVSNEETSEMSVLDLSAGVITRRVRVGAEPEGVTVRPGGAEVYVTCEEDNEVYAVHTSTLDVVARMKTAARPRSIVFTRDGSTAFVTDENAGVVTVLDAANRRTAGTIAIPRSDKAGRTPPRPMGSVLSHDGRLVLVSLGRARSVAIIDVAARTVVRTIDDVGARPWGIDVSADGAEAYTANGPSGDVSVIDLASGAVTRRIRTGGSPWGLVAR